MPLNKKTPPSKYNRADADSWIDVLNTVESNNGVRVYRTTPQSIPSGGSIIAVAFDSEAFDSGGWHSPAQQTRITAPLNGMYLVGGTLEYPGGLATGSRYAVVVLDGATHVAFATSPGSATDTVGVSVTTLIRLTAGQYIELCAFQTSGSTQLLSVVVPRAPNFWAVRLLA